MPVATADMTLTKQFEEVIINADLFLISQFSDEQSLKWTMNDNEN